MSRKNLHSLGTCNIGRGVAPSGRTFVVPFANYTTATASAGDTMIVTTDSGFYVFQFNAATTGGAGFPAVINIGTFAPYQGTAG